MQALYLLALEPVAETMQALYLLALEPVAETTADDNSYGFRHGGPQQTRVHDVLPASLNVHDVLPASLNAIPPNGYLRLTLPVASML